MIQWSFSTNLINVRSILHEYPWYSLQRFWITILWILWPQEPVYCGRTWEEGTDRRDRYLWPLLIIIGSGVSHDLRERRGYKDETKRLYLISYYTVQDRSDYIPLQDSVLGSLEVTLLDGHQSKEGTK